ncbi:MAG: hypothetical protein H7Z42_04870 [Roseiflexaceae bacterium]|nr:hypothetical protein [Roseiflexaceae bacterium]
MARRAQPLAAVPAQRDRLLLARIPSERVLLALILSVALVQGLLYLVIAPPWQHYDEPGHLEYVRLIADYGALPEEGTHDPALRREILNTLFATNFFRNSPPAALLSDDGEVWLGITQLGHPPLYYALAALPVGLINHLDIYTQLYVARGVSLLLFVLTVAVCFGLMRDLLPAQHPLRWAVPLIMALWPSFADVMTAVSNDTTAALVGSLFLWGAVRLIRRGWGWQRVLWTAGAAALGLWTKNTTVIMLALLPVALALAWLAHARRVQLRRLALGGLIITAIAALLLITTGDAAAWYRWSSGEAQPEGTLVQSALAPHGTGALLLQASADSPLRQLSNPLLPEAIPAMSGGTVTFGGWFWSDQPGQAQVGLRITSAAARQPSDSPQQLTLTTTPTFHAWQAELPAQLLSASYVVYAGLPAGATEQRVYIDGAVLADGAFPIVTPPQFADSAATGGSWGQRPFTNLLRNAAVESSWLRLQPWVEHQLFAFIHRSPSQIFAALLDWQRVGPQMFSLIVPVSVDSFTSFLGKGDVRLGNPIWRDGARLVFGLLVFSAVIGLVRSFRQTERTLPFALLLLALAATLAWANLILRPLPLLVGLDAWPMARYTFPAIVATILALVGGPWLLVPRRARGAALGLLLIAMLAYNAAALNAIWNAGQP